VAATRPHPGAQEASGLEIVKLFASVLGRGDAPRFAHMIRALTEASTGRIFGPTRVVIDPRVGNEGGASRAAGPFSESLSLG
jgi:hypothetical protein